MVPSALRVARGQRRALREAQALAAGFWKIAIGIEGVARLS